MTHLLLALPLLISISALSSVNAADRPPQFVLLAFDNCQENQTWKQVSSFLDEMNKVQNDRLRFTFFLSAVGLLSDRVKGSYIDPVGRSGKSNIDFGGNDLSVLERVQWINKLHSAGNEIASHAVGHFQGGKWSMDQWRHEMKQFNSIIDNVVRIHGRKDKQAKQGTLLFSSKDIKGFRAPYLEGGSRLNQVLLENGYSYDTSDTNQGFDPKNWPAKKDGLWNFGLGFMKIQLTSPGSGTGIRSRKLTSIPAMDYNFCYRQTGGCANKDPFAAEAEKDAQEMLAGYVQYFLTNYNGNRAPLHIGHHFFQYRGGVYNKVLFRFAKAVCALPEVRCTTYKELAEFMDTVGSEKRNQYQASKFPKGRTLEIYDLKLDGSF